MKPEQKLPTRKWVSYLLFASLIIASLISAPIVNAQSEGPQTPSTPSVITPTATLTTDTPEPSATQEAVEAPTLAPSDTAAPVEPAAALQLGPDGADWSLDYEVQVPDEQMQALGTSEQARRQAESMLAAKGLEARGITYQVGQNSGSRYKVSLKGKSSLNALRSLLFADLQPELDLLNGPIALSINVPVQRGQDIPLLLESRPATGYIWELDPAASTGVAQADEPALKARVEQASAPATEGLRLRATDDGQAAIRLVYHRPWETGQTATRQLNLTLSALPESVDLSNPVTVEQTAPPVLELPMVGEPSVSLPSSFDWRAQGKTPPVRDQGSCGSCWSFGTVGAMESAMMVQGGLPAPNLSEQFLISCNKDNYGCNGGWWAHDYHVSKLGTNQTTAGAVLESVKPYTGTKGTCSANVSKAYNLGSWGYVNGGYSSVPTVDQIKNAIYTYGPVAAAVCSGSAWGSYRGGVFSTDEKSQCTGSGQVNHAIVLVGWNDADQTWLLRNSWGSSWGDSGYMHIRWGTSNVGYGASYVVFKGSAPAPTQPAPTATKAPTSTKAPTATKVPTATRTPTKAPTPLPPPASNDSISGAKTIDHQGGPVTYSDSASTTGATNEGGDPYYPTRPANQFYNTVWYKFTPVSTGTLAIDTLSSGYDTVLGVWTGTPGSFKLLKWADNSSGRKTSSLKFTTGKGITYYIEVASKIAGGGGLQFHLKYTPSALANNSISSSASIKYAGNVVQSNYAIVLDVSRSTTVTSDPDFPNGKGKGYRTTWFKFLPKKNGTLTVSTGGSNFGSLLGVWTKSGSKYTLIGWTTGSSAQIPLSASKTYYIEVASTNSSGPSALRFSSIFSPAP